MKNIIKTVWSCWDKIDRFVAIFSIVGIILLTCVMCSSCNAQTTNNIPVMEYNCVDTLDTTICDNCGILFYADGIIDFVYEPTEDRYYIEYDDPDAFDPDYMKYNSLGKYYYIEIECDSNTFFSYLSWLRNIPKDSYDFFKPSKNYFINECKFENGETYYTLNYVHN